MADQKLVAIHHVTFLIEKFSYQTYEPSIFEKPPVLWFTLTNFPIKHGSLELSIKIHPKFKSLKVLKCSLLVENTQYYRISNCQLFMYIIYWPASPGRAFDQ